LAIRDGIAKEVGWRIGFADHRHLPVEFLLHRS